MAETSSNTYLTCYIKNGKVIDQFFLNMPDEVKTMEAVGRAKGYETETHVICSSDEEREETAGSDIAQQELFQEPKRPWNKWIKCVETGQVFPTVRECCKSMDIPYMTIYNCIKNKNATRGYHFVIESNRFEAFRNMDNHNKDLRGMPPRKVMCLTNGVIYDSVKDCLRACHLPVSSFYRALHGGTPIKGLLFKYQ